MADNLKIFHDTDSSTIKIKDNMRLNSEKMKLVSSDDLKTNQYNSSSYMKPALNEEIHRTDNVKANFKILENDLNLLANPKKTKKFTSSDEEESSSEDSSDDISTEISDNDTARDATNLMGRPEDLEEDEDSYDEATANSSSSASSSSGSGSGEDTLTSNSSRRAPPQRQKTLEEIQQEKQEMIYRLERLEQSGYRAGRKFNMSSNYEEIKGEYDRLKKQRDVDKSIKFQRKILMAVTSGIEFLNGKFDPFSVKLDGWSESIYENLHEYDEVFEDLHEKYKEKVKVAPEVRLLMMVGGSAFMFHLTNTLFKSKMPGLGDILQQNPELAKNVQQAAMNTMRQNEAKTGNQDPLFSMMMNQAQSMMGPKPNAAGTAGPSRPMGPGVKEMRGPSGVDDILSMVNNRPPTQVAKEDTISSVSSQESGNKRRIKIRKPVASSSKNSNGKFVLDL